MSFADIALVLDGDFDKSHDISGVLNESDDAIAQFSRAQTQRATKARQRLDRKKEEGRAVVKETKENVETIETTISEDLTDGLIANLESSLKLLGREDDPVLLIPSDDLEEDEIHIIEANHDNNNNGNRALQDYQMQLMLLEQQNKKRLLMARQEQDPLSTLRQIINFDPNDAARELARRYQRGSVSQVQALLKRPDSRSAKTTADLSMAPVRGSTVTTDVMPQRKRQKRTRAPKHQEDDVNIAQDADSTVSSAALQVEQLGSKVDQNVRDGKSATRRLDTLYLISCQQNNELGSRPHPALAFRDTPVPTVTQPPHLTLASPAPVPNNPHHEPQLRFAHLNGQLPMLDVDSFMENDSGDDDTAFVVIRTVECSQAAVLIACAGGPLRWTEEVYMKSRIAKDLLRSIASCYFQPVLVKDDPYIYVSPPRPEAAAPQTWQQNKIEPSELFFYHHRNSLKSHGLLDPEARPCIDMLLTYVDGRYGEEYHEAETLFADGLVSQAHILKLFKPNEIIISGTYGRPAAFVLHEWPTLSRDGWVSLSCWSFQNDGSGFTRKRSELLIPPIEAKHMEIKRLPGFPLAFAAPDLVEGVRTHGLKQWKLRVATQITYKGWNVARDQYYV